MRPLVEETDGVQMLNIYGPVGQIIAQVVEDGQGGQEVRYLQAGPPGVHAGGAGCRRQRGGPL